MTPVEEAVERVRAYVGDREGVSDAWLVGNSVLTLGDLQALLSALELGRLDAEAGEAPAGRWVHVDGDCNGAPGGREWVTTPAPRPGKGVGRE